MLDYNGCWEDLPFENLKLDFKILTKKNALKLAMKRAKPSSTEFEGVETH